MRKKIYYLITVLVCVTVFLSMWTKNLLDLGKLKRLSAETIVTTEYREQKIDANFLPFLYEQSSPGTFVGTYLLESKFGYQPISVIDPNTWFLKAQKYWCKNEDWEDYIQYTKAIWDDVKYFPVPEFSFRSQDTISYSDSWMSRRSFGGERGHEGTDIIANHQERGYYPVVSMSDGIVAKKGWLTKGGHRIGILTDQNVYFYYAHLDSYAHLEIGDPVDAGDILGFMGDSGYGPEGTIGQFAVHLHVGIYIYPRGKETSVNPYWILRYIENSKVKCYTEK